MDQLEKKLSEQMWVGGDKCSDADKEALISIGDITPNVTTHPHSYAWFSLVYNFTWA